MKEIARRAATYDNWKDRIYTFIMGPGWEPGKPRLGNYKEIPKVMESSAGTGNINLSHMLHVTGAKNQLI